MTVVDKVSLVQYGDKRIVRTLVAVENGYLFVCKEEEWEAARREGREPMCIGFRAEYLVSAR
jgi:hypothetical protein